MLESLQQEFADLQTRQQVYKSVVQCLQLFTTNLYVYKTNSGLNNI